MSNFLKKLLFLLKKPPVILVVGADRTYTKKAISQVLKTEVLISELDPLEPKEIKKFNFLLKKSRLPILVVTGGENTEIKKLAVVLPVYGFLILNFDDEAVRKMRNETKAHLLTYGFQEGADLKATDINVSLEGTNFKVNHQGNIIPFWLKGLFGKEQIYNVLAAACVGVVKDMNLVEISQAIKKPC